SLTPSVSPSVGTSGNNEAKGLPLRSNKEGGSICAFAKRCFKASSIAVTVLGQRPLRCVPLKRMAQDFRFGHAQGRGLAPCPLLQPYRSPKVKPHPLLPGRRDVSYWRFYLCKPLRAFLHKRLCRYLRKYLCRCLRRCLLLLRCFTGTDQGVQGFAHAGLAISGHRFSTSLASRA